MNLFVGCWYRGIALGLVSKSHKEAKKRLKSFSVTGGEHCIVTVLELHLRFYLYGQRWGSVPCSPCARLQMPYMMRRATTGPHSASSACFRKLRAN